MMLTDLLHHLGKSFELTGLVGFRGSAASSASRRTGWTRMPTASRSSLSKSGPTTRKWSLTPVSAVPISLERCLWDSQTTDMHLGRAHCLASRAPTLDLWLEITKKWKFVSQGSSELQNYDLNFLLYCKPNWHNKVNRWTLVLANVFHTIQ